MRLQATDPHYVRKLPLVFVDTETGGLDPKTDALLSVAAVRTGPSGNDVLASLDRKVIPHFGLRVTPEAAAVNGYTPEKWTDAQPESLVLVSLFEILRGAVWVGHFPKFDVDFLSAAYERHGQKLPLGYRYIIDTGLLAWPLLKVGRLSDLKLTSVAGSQGFVQKEPHTAFDDVETCRAVYLSLMRTLHAGVGTLVPSGGQHG